MDRKYETDRWPVVLAKHFTKVTDRRKVRLIVIHSMEAPEKVTTAEAVAKYFRTGTVKASAHVCIDSDSIVQSVMDNDIAYAAPGANHDGIQIELAGYAKQTTKEWLDPYGVLMLDKAANVAAQYCLKYRIPSVNKLTDAQLKSGVSGIVGHDQVSRVYKKSTHTDPGKNFPWTYFVERVNHHHSLRV